MHAGPGPASDGDQMSPPIRRGTAHWAPVRGTVVTSTVTAGGKPVDRTQPDNAKAVSEEQRVTDKDHDQTSDEVTVETTSVFRADFLNELDAPAQTGSETAVSGVEGLPVGSALLVVKRGPNAGSRFLLDPPTTSAGRPPHSDIFPDPASCRRRPRARRIRVGARGVPGGRRRQPEWPLRHPRAGRLSRAGQRRRGADRQISPGIPDRPQGR